MSQLVLRSDVKRASTRATPSSFLRYAVCLLRLTPAFFLTGCVYPAYKQAQPYAEIKVVDQNARPIEGAKVTLIAAFHAGPYPVPNKQKREFQLSGADGIVLFEGKREWLTQVVMMHGDTYYRWAICVQKPGFATHKSAYESEGDFKSQQVVTLTVGNMSDCQSADFF